VREHATECARALIGLAAAGHESAVAAILRADPHGGECTWTLACYQIGDLSPSALRDFSEASPALVALAGCETPSHVAAELIVTNDDGVRWTALVRSGYEVIYQPLGKSNATASTDSLMLGVRHRWEDQLLSWASCVDKGLDPAPPIQANPPASREAAGELLSIGTTMGQVLEAVRKIEQRLPDSGAGLAAAQAGEVTALSARLDEVIRQTEDLRHDLAATHTRLAAMQTRLVASEDRVAYLESEVRRIAATSTVPPGRWVAQHAAPGLSSMIAQRVLARFADWCARLCPPRSTGDEGRRIELVPARERRPDWPG
jgi:hypothetical protein